MTVSKILILFSHLSGYLAACLKELRNSHAIEVLIYAYPANSGAPFDYSEFSECGQIVNRYEVSDEEILQEAQRFKPDVVLISGWSDRGYLSVCNKLRQSEFAPLVVAGIDTQWTGSFRQRVGVTISPWLLNRSIDIMWASGERQWQFAKRLGYRGSRVWDGYYSCDWDSFSSASYLTRCIGGAVPRRFLFVGRYVSIKGIEELAEAYKLYVKSVDEPWELLAAGRGPMKGKLDAAGITDLGFTKPSKLPELMGSVGCFILPSRYEPWGVVLHEAGATGLPVIASDVCGASVHLVRAGWNGYVFEAGSSEALADALLRMHSQSDEFLVRMGLNSYELSKQYTPRRWSDQIVNGTKNWKIDQLS